MDAVPLAQTLRVSIDATLCYRRCYMLTQEDENNRHMRHNQREGTSALVHVNTHTVQTQHTHIECHTHTHTHVSNTVHVFNY